MKQIPIIIAIFFISISIASAANIHGTVYDMGLDKVTNAIVEVDSSPKQRMVTVDGMYSFNLPKGDYTLTASYSDEITLQTIEEKITVVDDGDYVLDLFLFIDISGEEELFNSSDMDIEIPYQRNLWPYVLGSILLLFIVAFIVYRVFYHKKRLDKSISKRDDKDLEKVILILKKHGGRATQKDIRREIPLSEAKISLMISELESEGKVKRIKKGRGNIIVLQ